MKLKDLKVNDVLEFRNNQKYKVVYAGKFILLVEIDGTDYTEIVDLENDNIFNADMTSKIDSEYDVVKIIRDDKIIEVNKNKYKTIKEFMDSDVVDNIMNLINDLELDDKELIEERKELNKQYKKFKKNKDKDTIKNIKEDIKNNLDVSIEDITVKDIDGGVAVYIEGKGKISEDTKEKISEYVRKGLDL